MCHLPQGMDAGVRPTRSVELETTLAGEVAAWRLDVRAVLPLKEVAIAAHRSQTTDLIADDSDGFRLLPHVLAHFTRPWEIFLEEQGG